MIAQRHHGQELESPRQAPSWSPRQAPSWMELARPPPPPPTGSAKALAARWEQQLSSSASTPRGVVPLAKAPGRPIAASPAKPAPLRPAASLHAVALAAAQCEASTSGASAPAPAVDVGTQQAKVSRATLRLCYARVAPVGTDLERMAAKTVTQRLVLKVAKKMQLTAQGDEGRKKMERSDLKKLMHYCYRQALPRLALEEVTSRDLLGGQKSKSTADLVMGVMDGAIGAALSKTNSDAVFDSHPTTPLVAPLIMEQLRFDANESDITESCELSMQRLRSSGGSSTQLEFPPAADTVAAAVDRQGEGGDGGDAQQPVQKSPRGVEGPSSRSVGQTKVPGAEESEPAESESLVNGPGAESLGDLESDVLT
eukprot:gnl/TRDRNA2_/TRDRNA2_175118_c1_seq9.p1 gnl/TRDRNA2_/TRDRNA2_175118_c1~~gnl/TRDRNA2_/TRDRNA2_175118_c1_seq9.p1  ORF type:complete len:432 (+),score=89.72 gnl/TRDRNA2_/TRDRNA2_175118_c1_seq9:191-1297(+)